MPSRPVSQASDRVFQVVGVEPQMDRVGKHGDTARGVDRVDGFISGGQFARDIRRAPGPRYRAKASCMDLT